MLHICYSGILDGFNPGKPKYGNNFWKDWFWTYHHLAVDPSTRTGCYLIHAVKILYEKYKVKPDQLKISLWGIIDNMNIKQVAENHLDSFFEILGYLSKEISMEKMLSADMLFLPLEKSNIKGQGTLFIPGKLYEYLHFGKPILALCEDSDCKTILLKSRLGICVEPDDPEKIAGTMLKFINNKKLLDDIKPNTEYINGFSYKCKTGELVKTFDLLLK